MTSRRTCFIGIALMIASLAMVSQPAYALEDVLGWEGTTWRMTESEVTAYAESRGYHLLPGQPGPGGAMARYIPFHAAGEVGGSASTVVFEFSDRTRRLSAVLIGAVDQFRERAVKMHASLLDSLTARYGAPTTADSRGTVASVTRWRFKTTSITLRLETDMGSSGHHATQVSLVYAPTGADERDADQRFLLLTLLKLLGEGRRP